MDMSGAYQGSMAFNQYLSLHESICLNTGSLTVARPLVSLPGINESINLSISLTYSVNVQGVLGLPNNWTFNIPYVVPGATATLDGQTYIIDFNWSDESGYQSGLRYVNNHGVRFQATTQPLPLPSGNGGSYAFLYTRSDGSCDLFDATGKLLEHDDVFGNYNYYTYANQFAGVYGNFLTSVVDSYGQTVRFSYAPNAITVELPNGNSITINYSSQGVANVVDELGCTTSFGYGQSAGYDVVNQITYPTGLCTRISYATIPYTTSLGAAAFPAVSSLLHLDGGSVFMSETNYTYGLKTNGNTYTGQSAGYLLSDSDDGLMDSNNTSYLYDTTVSVVDANATLLAYSEYYYNYLHCLMVKNVFLVEQEGALQPCFQITNSYEIDSDWHARTTNYNKPNASVTTAWSTAGGQFVPTQQSTFTYDLFGNPLTTTIAMYDAASESYVQQSASTFSYVGANWGGEMPLTTVLTDSITGYSRSSTYALTADHKNIASVVQAYQATEGGPTQPWKRTTYTYDGQGRKLSEELSWSAGAANPNPKLASATTSYAYAYDLGSNTLTTTKTDPLGNVAVNETLTSYPMGVIATATNPLGQSTAFAYDAIGRLTTTTDPLGNLTTLSYTCAQQGMCNRVRVVTPVGYITDVYCDGLGRQVKVMDNGEAASSGVERVLSQIAYNAQGLAASVTGILGLATTYQYDALGRMTASTDPHSNFTTVLFGDKQLVATISLNGVKQSQQVSDGLGRLVSLARYASPDSAIDYYFAEITSYDGEGRPVSVTSQQYPLSGAQPNPLTLMSRTYDFDGRVATESFNGYQTQTVSAVKTIQRDLFGNVSSYSKTVSYPGGRSYQWSSETFVYDACSNLISRINQLQQTESYSYTAAGSRASCTRYDGTVISYNYDANSNMTVVTSGTDTTTYDYYPDNNLKSVSQGGATIGYQYFIDGGLRQTTYPDGTSQTITVDQYSRIVNVIDFGGASTSIQYTPLGQLASKQSGSQQLTYTYGVVNGVNDILVSAAMTGGATVVNYAYTYDGYGRLATTSATLAGSSSGPLLAATYSYDALNRTVGLATTTGTSTTTISYVYDGLNQVAAQTSTNGSLATTTTYLYDGNTNVVSTTVDGTTQTLSYNAIDQLMQAGVLYDDNGRLVQDNAGNSYTFDVFDKLIASSGSSGSINYFYYPDGMLATRAALSASSTFYYGDGTATQIRNTASGQDGWLSFMFNGRARLICIDAAGQVSYFLTANDSTMAVCDGGTVEPLQYQAYGSQREEQHASAPAFAWKQEYADPGNGLIYLRARFYNPALMSFLSMDSYPVSNRYAFGNGNPIDNSDPTGHLSHGAAMGIGIGLGILATLLTGGALGVVVGTDIVASAAVGTAAGAVGSVAGDATSAKLSGQPFTGERALIDLAAGAGGGAAGALAGGLAGRGAMALAQKGELSRGAITVIGAASAGTVGGGTGAAASSAVTSSCYGQPFFSSATAFNTLIGGVAGLGGGILASGAHFGMGRPGDSNVGALPIRATPDQNNFFTAQYNSVAGRVVDFSPSDGDNIADPALRFGGRDAVVVHGFMRHVFPETASPTGEINTQYMTPEDFATLLRNNYGFGGSDINLWSCFAARLYIASVAKRLATALKVNVWAPDSRNSVTLAYQGGWIEYRP